MRIHSRNTGWSRVWSNKSVRIPARLVSKVHQRKTSRSHHPSITEVLVALDNAHLERNGTRHLLMPGMQVNAEIHLGTRSVMEYLLSPIQKVVHEAGRER